MFLFAVQLLVSSETAFAQKTGKQAITVENVWREFRFYARSAEQIEWMKDDQYISTMDESNNLNRFPVGNPREQEKLIDGSKLKTADGPLRVQSYEFSQDERKVLLLTDRQPIYRHSASYRAFVYDRDSDRLIPVAKGARVQLPTLSPDGRHVAYAQSNNLYAQPLAEGSVVQLTSDGKVNEVINGVADWVYEEEFTLKRAFEWSPDSRFIAFYRFDESQVPEFTLVNYPDSAYPSHYRYKYPKAGEVNSAVQVHVYDLERRVAQAVDIGQETDQYIARIGWAPVGESLTLIRLNRLQNRVDVLLADARTGRTRTLLTETTETYINEVEDHTLTFLPDGKSFIWQSERDGYNHLYLYDLQGQLRKQLTQGQWDVTAFYGLDAKNKTLYFQSTAVSSIERHVYSLGLESGVQQQLSSGSGWHEADFSSNFTYYLKTYSSATQPPVVELHEASGTKLMTLVDNARMLQNIEQYAIRPKEFFEFKTSDGQTLNGYRIMPANLKKKDKVPVLMFVYGGPGSQMVSNRYDPLYYFWFQTFVSQGYMVVCVDNRGTGGKGAQFKKSTYANLGHYEAQDQIEVARWLGTQPNVDPARIGIWGWSFGGYLSSLCLLLGNDVFKTAVAVAPVTNWRYYDTIYTERFLKTPQLNPDGYDKNSPLTYADRLKGNYLIIHGMADDNVHPQNAMRMIKELVNHNKKFDVMLYPDQNHGIGGGNARFHVFNKITDYLLKNL